MPETPHVVAVCGSLRDESVTRAALERALDGVEERGGEAELLDLRDHDLPAFDPDDIEPCPPTPESEENIGAE